jgi:hypothetical protein
MGFPHVLKGGDLLLQHVLDARFGGGFDIILEGQKQLHLILEMPVDGTTRHAGGFGYIAKGRTRIALLMKQLKGGIQNILAGLFRFGLGFACHAISFLLTGAAAHESFPPAASPFFAPLRSA